MMGPISEYRLNQVHPTLAAKIRQMATSLLPVPLLVTRGLATWEEQQAIWDEGRTTPGAIVTKAQPGYSWHEFGLACDVCPLDMLGKPDWNVSHSDWVEILQLGLTLGLVEGACFHSIKDNPHFQLTGKLPVTPDDATRQLFKSGNLAAVWAATGLDASVNVIPA